MRLLFLASLMALASCAATGPPVRARVCPILTSSGWTAWVNALPSTGGTGPTLMVVGKVTVPTGGWRFEWTDARVMESYPVQVAMDLQAIAPAGGAIQAVMTQEVRFSMPLQPPVGSVTVRCGDRVLARIAPVEIAY